MRIQVHQPNIIEPDMTPMIDIVFQLITFFMVVTNFEQTQADERVKLPADELARPPIAPREQEVVVNVGFLRDKDGNLTDPTPYVFQADELIRVMDYGTRLRMEARVAETKKQDPRAITVVIRSDGETPTGLVQELMRMGQEAGFEKFAFKARAKALGE
jgi:biopolymer transport protein ExbD